MLKLSNKKFSIADSYSMAGIANNVSKLLYNQIHHLMVHKVLSGENLLLKPWSNEAIMRQSISDLETVDKNSYESISDRFIDRNGHTRDVSHDDLGNLIQYLRTFA